MVNIEVGSIVHVHATIQGVYCSMLTPLWNINTFMSKKREYRNSKACVHGHISSKACVHGLISRKTEGYGLRARLVPVDRLA